MGNQKFKTKCSAPFQTQFVIILNSKWILKIRMVNLADLVSFTQSDCHFETNLRRNISSLSFACISRREYIGSHCYLLSAISPSYFRVVLNSIHRRQLRIGGDGTYSSGEDLGFVGRLVGVPGREGRLRSIVVVWGGVGVGHCSDQDQCVFSSSNDTATHLTWIVE